jgi:hypothetical protein
LIIHLDSYTPTLTIQCPDLLWLLCSRSLCFTFFHPPFLICFLLDTQRHLPVMCSRWMSSVLLFIPRRVAYPLSPPPITYPLFLMSMLYDRAQLGVLCNRNDSFRRTNVEHRIDAHVRVIRKQIRHVTDASPSALLVMHKSTTALRRGLRSSARVYSTAIPPTTQVTTLPNGIRVATENSAGHFSALGLYVDAGSRYETPLSSGTSHFLDRMAFKVYILSMFQCALRRWKVLIIMCLSCSDHHLPLRRGYVIHHRLSWWPDSRLILSGDHHVPILPLPI